MKTCTKCGEEKPPSDFHRDKNRKDGLYLWCKVCVNAAAKAYCEANREAVRERNTAWAKANPKQMNTYKAKWKKNNASYLANYEASHRDAINARQRKWDKRNPEKVSESRKRQHDRAREQITPAYAAGAMRLRVAELTPELIDLKREQLRLHRIAQKLQKAVAPPKDKQ